MYAYSKRDRTIPTLYSHTHTYTHSNKHKFALCYLPALCCCVYLYIHTRTIKILCTQAPHTPQPTHRPSRSFNISVSQVSKLGRIHTKHIDSECYVYLCTPSKQTGRSTKCVGSVSQGSLVLFSIRTNGISEGREGGGCGARRQAMAVHLILIVWLSACSTPRLSQLKVRRRRELENRQFAVYN